MQQVRPETGLLEEQVAIPLMLHGDSERKTHELDSTRNNMSCLENIRIIRDAVLEYIHKCRADRTWKRTSRHALLRICIHL